MMGQSLMRRRCLRSERAAVAVEFAVIVPVLLLLIGVVIAGGRMAITNQTVQQMADSAARAASLARTATEARADADLVVHSDARDAGLKCVGGIKSSVDTGGFSAALGQAADVSVTVRCGVALGDLLVPGLPGTWFASAEATSPLDRYRSR